MPTENDNAKLVGQLRAASADILKNIKLPGSIRFTIDDTLVQMHLASSCVRANMQANSSSFEGWALALMRWLPNEVDRVELSWDFDGNVHDPHYQRFLFRVRHLKVLFPWFVLSPRQEELISSVLKTEGVGPYYVTSSKKHRATAEKDKSEDIQAAIKDEHKLECFINDHPEVLCELIGLTRLDRQFPVGLFDGPVCKANGIFPRGHSAIDLVGINGDDLVLFELKAEGNVAIGILSEMLFYSYIMEGVQWGRYKIQGKGRNVLIDRNVISSTKAIQAYILAPKWHPLIDEGMLKMVNEAFRKSGRDIRFGAVKIVPRGVPHYRLEMKVCDVTSPP